MTYLIPESYLPVPTYAPVALTNSCLGWLDTLLWLVCFSLAMAYPSSTIPWTPVASGNRCREVWDGVRLHVFHVRDWGCRMDCPRCKQLEAEVAALRHRIVSLNRIITDMSGQAALELDNDPYEDEQPMIHGREDR
jgi:hypothetical protein